MSSTRWVQQERARGLLVEAEVEVRRQKEAADERTREDKSTKHEAVESSW